MNMINVDIKKIKTCGTDIMELAISYGEQVEELFKKLSNVDWSGNAADEFIKQLKIEKKQFKNLKNNLYNEGKFLYNSALELEKVANELKR